MKKTKDNEQLINRFIEHLESIGIEIGTKLDRMEKERQDYEFFVQMKSLLDQSKEDFCASYFELEEEEKEIFQKRLLRLFKDQEIVDNIMQEIVNLYYLKESGLIDLEEIAPQKELAHENLETLSTKIEKFIQGINIDQLNADEQRLSDSIDRLVDLGSILEGEVLSPIEDISYLEEVLEMTDLTGEEKKQILIEIITHNIEIYQMNLEEKANQITTSIEQNKQETEGFLEDSENLSISPECLQEINELLSRKEIIQRIVRVVNDDFTMMINITSPTPEEKEFIDSSIELAREDMIESIKENKEMTPREALEVFFQKYDEINRRKKEALEDIFADAEESTLTREEQKEKMSEGLEFYESHKQLISSLRKEDKERILQYMRELYMKKENRDLLYESKAYESTEEIEKEAAYELQVIKELLEVVEEEDTSLYSKICKRMEDILESVNRFTQEQTPITQDEGNVFFLMKTDKESHVEFDLDLESHSKGISPQYYGELKNQIDAIAGRGERKLISAQPVNAAFKYIRKQGVRYTMGNRTKVFFIPVGKKDAIIIGAGFITGKDSLKDYDMKIKRHLGQIEALKKRLAQPETYEEESRKAKEVRQRIMSSLDSKELDEMFEDTSSSEATETKKII